MQDNHTELPEVNTSPAVVNTDVSAIRQWYQSGGGRHTATAIQTVVAEMSNEVFGYYAVQVGDLGGRYDLLQESRIKNCFRMAVGCHTTHPVDLVAEPVALPFDFDNLDLVIASHVLDYTTQPHQVLREIERVLMAEGHCILIAFNPFSVRGLKLLWKKLLKQNGSQSLYSAFRLRDWFEVLGFEVLEVRSVGQYKLFETLPLIRKISGLQNLLDRYYQWFGQVQLIHVQKKVSKLTPLKPRLKTRPLLKPGIAVNSNGVGKTAGKAVMQGKNHEKG
ncbi:MAG: hypothetical protein CSA79_01245 [Thiothrix nivea]|nr:MAG: hypothetical protein CSA79_01245 [Thiothrix nivea]